MTPKKIFISLSIVLAAVLLFVIIVYPRQELSNTVTFYYQRASFAHGVPNGTIGSEQREVGGHEGDLNYLLALYLEGPLDKGLKSALPGPEYVRILEIGKRGDALHITLSDLSNLLTDSQFTLACACMTKTCMELYNVQAVQITSGDRVLRMNPANLQFYDESTSVVQPKTEEEK